MIKGLTFELLCIISDNEYRALLKNALKEVLPMNERTLRELLADLEKRTQSSWLYRRNTRILPESLEKNN